MTRVNMPRSQVSSVDPSGTREWTHRHILSHWTKAPAWCFRCFYVLRNQMKLIWMLGSQLSVQQKGSGERISPGLPAGCCLLNGKCYGSAWWATNTDIFPKCVSSSKIKSLRVESSIMQKRPSVHFSLWLSKHAWNREMYTRAEVAVSCSNSRGRGLISSQDKQTLITHLEVIT